MHLQACSGICDTPTGVAHEKMSLGHFSVSGCSRNLGRPRAINPGNGNVPITPLWLPQLSASLPTWPQATCRSHQAAAWVQKYTEKPVSSIAWGWPTPSWSPGHWGLGTCSVSVLGSSWSDISLSHQAKLGPGISSQIGFLEVTGVRDQMHCEATGGERIFLD